MPQTRSRLGDAQAERFGSIESVGSKTVHIILGAIISICLLATCLGGSMIVFFMDASIVKARPDGGVSDYDKLAIGTLASATVGILLSFLLLRSRK